MRVFGSSRSISLVRSLIHHHHPSIQQPRPPRRPTHTHKFTDRGPDLPGPFGHRRARRQRAGDHNIQPRLLLPGRRGLRLRHAHRPGLRRPRLRGHGVLDAHGLPRHDAALHSRSVLLRGTCWARRSLSIVVSFARLIISFLPPPPQPWSCSNSGSSSFATSLDKTKS